MDYARVVDRLRRDPRIWTEENEPGRKFGRVLLKAIHRKVKAYPRRDDLADVLRVNTWLCRADFM